VATIALDYAFGWESVGGFQRTFEAEGGRITQKIWVPVSVHDFAPYLAQVSRDIDAVYALVLGRAALQFMRQYQEFGLKERVRLIGGGTTTDEHVLPFMGDEAIGVITALHYSAVLDTPANRTFAAAYRARYKKVPSYYAESMYTGAKWFVAAIEAVGGNVEDSATFLDALRNVKPVDLPRGPVELDEYGSPIENVYIRKVERVNGELQNTVIETFPRVSQFWKYNPAEYLKQPLYSRRYVPRPSTVEAGFRLREASAFAEAPADRRSLGGGRSARLAGALAEAVPPPPSAGPAEAGTAKAGGRPNTQ
jgi:branched-chain amino acid transport system substrate-binding protein